MQQIINQNHRAVKGLDSLDLASQRRIVRERFDRLLFQLRIVHFICMQRLRHRIRNNFSTQDLAERHAHRPAEVPRRHWVTRHTIQRRDPFHQTMVNHARRHRKNQLSRIEARHHHLQFPMRLVDRIQNARIAGKWFF